MSKEYITFYQIAKELYREKALQEGLQYKDYNELANDDPNKAEAENKFRNFRKQMQEYFEHIFKNLGINPKLKYKVGIEYQIPFKEKEIIKLLIRQYSGAVNKKIRRGEKPDVKDIEIFLNEAKSVIEANYEDEELEKQMGILYAVTEYNSKKAAKEVIDRLNELIKSNIDCVKIDESNFDSKQVLANNRKIASSKKFENLTNIFNHESLLNNPKIRSLDDSDAEYLILLYEQILIGATSQWNRIADIYSEIRDEEIEEALSEDISSEKDNEKRYKEPGLLASESIKQMYEELESEIKHKKITEEEIKKFDEIMESLIPNRN